MSSLFLVLLVLKVPPGEQGPPGPQGPAGDTRQTIVTLHDDAEGHAAGWDPGPDVASWTIQAPVDLITDASFEATAVNPATDPRAPTQHRVAECHVFLSTH